MIVRRIRRTLLNLGLNYQNPLDEQRARVLLVINWVMLVAWLLWLVYTLVASLNAGASLNLLDVFGFLPAPLVFAGIYGLVTSGRLRAASWLFIGFLFATMTGPVLEDLAETDILLLVVPLLSAGLLLGRRGTLAGFGVALVILTIGAFNQAQLTEELITIPADMVALDAAVSVGLFLIIAVFLYTFGGNAQRLADESLRDIRQFQAVARFAGRVRPTAESDVYAGIIKLLKDELGFSFGQMFRVDDDGHVYQRLRLRQRGGLGINATDITPNPTSALYEAIRTQRVVMVFSSDNEFRRDQFLPSSSFGLLVPVVIDGLVVAVIDVQDNDTSFSETSVQALEALADQAARFIRDLRLINDLRANLHQQEQTVANLRTEVRELKRIQPEVVGSAWESYLDERGLPILGFDLRDDAPVVAHDLPDHIQATLHKGEIDITPTADGQIVSIPLVLRGEVVGAMSFDIPPGVTLEDRQIELARSVANRLAVALENKRLFEQSEARALRERKANEIANLLIRASDVDSVMTLAAETFNEALGAVRTRIHLQPEDEDKT